MTLILAHRGHVEGNPAPENTPVAFEAACDAGADGNELDARRCADALVTWHDAKAGDRPVRELTRDQIRERTGKLPALLNDALGFPYATEASWAIEIKDPEPETVREIIALIDDWQLPREKFIIISFHDGVLAVVKEIAPAMRTGLDLGRAWVDLGDGLSKRVMARRSELFPARRLMRCRADYVVPRMQLVNAGVLARTRRWPALVWDVNEDRDIQRMLRHPQVEAIITDRPLCALELAGRRPTA